jgi:hypothetical protein
MTPKEISKKLRIIAGEHKGYDGFNFGVRIYSMATESADAIDSLQAFVDMMNALPSCNDCTNKTCGYAPKLGHTVRYNCPLYRGPEQALCKVGDAVTATVVRPYNGHKAIIHGTVTHVMDKAFLVKYNTGRYMEFRMEDIGKTVHVEENKKSDPKRLELSYDDFLKYDYEHIMAKLEEAGFDLSKRIVCYGSPTSTSYIYKQD